jgi:hypothetical protein
MPIADSLCAGDPISLFVEIVVGSAFQVDAGGRARRRRGRVHRADLLPATPAWWTFDEPQWYAFSVPEAVQRGELRPLRSPLDVTEEVA